MNRHFSAPVRLALEQSEQDLLTLLAHDSDAVNRWDASQRLYTQNIQRLLEGSESSPAACASLVDALKQLLLDFNMDPALLAECLTLPSVQTLVQAFAPIDVLRLAQVRRELKRMIADALSSELLAVYQAQIANETAFEYTPKAMFSRRLKNVCLQWLTAGSEPSKAVALCQGQFQNSSDMTHSMGALMAIRSVDGLERNVLLDQFLDRWSEEPLVVDKWLAVQAGSELPDVLDRLQLLMQHASYDAQNPNRVRALVGTFCAANPISFHAEDGSGYGFLKEEVLKANAFNPQLAARLMAPLLAFGSYNAERQVQMKACIQAISEAPGLSKDVLELCVKSL